MTLRFIGRFHVHDAPMRMSAQDEARKTRVATFPGEHYSAEHEDGQLHVYAHHDEHGLPARRFGAEQGTSGIRSTIGDADRRSVRTLAELNQVNAQFYARRPRRRA
jgi:hypothetical protein